MSLESLEQRRYLTASDGFVSSCWIVPSPSARVCEMAIADSSATFAAQVGCSSSALLETLSPSAQSPVSPQIPVPQIILVADHATASDTCGNVASEILVDHSMVGGVNQDAVGTIDADADNAGGGGSPGLPMPRSIGDVIERISELIGRLNSAASDGKRDSLEEVARRAKVIADAGGYRSPDLKDMPEEYRQAVEEMESSAIITTATMIQWARYACGEEGWDDGWGDVWMRMEAWRLELLKARIQVILGAQQ